MTALKLPPGPFGAYLFDCDGTLADSMPVHFRAWTRAVEEHGGTFPEELFYAWAGIPLDRTVEMLNEKLHYTMPVAETVRRKEELYLELLPEVRAIPSVLAHVEREAGRIPFAVVSGSPHASVVRTLTVLGLVDKFPVVLGAEDYTHGKPAPEPFLRAAEILGVPPDRCLVFEDADAGIRSAEAAGMQWVRVPQRPPGPHGA
jgi:HAD superfamily hydrolase (TIGR01509 family)